MIVGQLVTWTLELAIFFGLAFGMVKCTKLARTPDCNPAAFRGLMWFLAAVLAFFIDSAPTTILGTAAIWGVRAALLWAAWRSGQALVQMRREPQRWKRGRRQAWTVVSFALLLVVLNVLALMGMRMPWITVPGPSS